MLKKIQVPVLLAVFLILSLVSSPTQAQKKNRKDKRGKVTEWCMKTKKAEKTGIRLDCKPKGSEGQGRIVDLSVRGVGNDDCVGLTAHLFVKINSCLWQESCEIKKGKKDKYMVKLYRGSPAKCITKAIKYFSISYQCAGPDVPVRDVLSGITQEISDAKGMVRSHRDHPWLYRRHGWAEDGKLILRRPAGNDTIIYTIQSLRLMFGDVLKVTTGKGETTEFRHDITNRTTHVISGAESLTFELVTTHYSMGGEGFVVCFQWVSGQGNIKDACSDLVRYGKRTSGMKTRCKKGKGGNGGNGRKRNRNANGMKKSKKNRKSKSGANKA